MDSQRLDRALRALPPERARPDFTARVLARLDAPPRPRRLPLALAGATAAALALALAAGHVRSTAGTRERAAEARRLLEELRREHRALAHDLDALAEEPPVLYLGGDDELDLVLDLSRVPPARPEGDRGTEPASNRTSGP
jgi:hypothetical protein